MNVYIIRHGDDDDRYRGGWTDLPLIDKGIEKCERLSNYMINHIIIDKIITSDLKRAKMTAEIINNKFNVPIEIDSRLRENNNGIFAGMLNEDAEKNYEHAHFGDLDYDERFPEGESPREFYERIKKDFFNIIKENNNIQNLAIVTHGGVISIVRHIVNGIEWSNKKKSMKITKTSISKLVVAEDKMYFEYENLTPHLDK